MMDPTEIQLFVGNTIAQPFRLRRRGDRNPWNVDAATDIRCEISGPDGAAETAIVADKAHPKAAWAEGRVIVVFTPFNVTGQQGTWNYTVTVSIDGEVISTDGGTLEVLPRPGA